MKGNEPLNEIHATPESEPEAQNKYKSFERATTRDHDSMSERAIERESKHQVRASHDYRSAHKI